MSTVEKEQKGIARRDFAKGAAAGAVGGKIGGTSLVMPKAELKPWLPEKWDKEADVVVVGYGGAGAAAAIAAHDAGAKVLILEKAPQGDEGGNTRASGNMVFLPTPEDRGLVYLKAMCGPYTIPDDMARVWVTEMNKNIDWLKSLGGNPVVYATEAEFPDLPGADCVQKYRNGPGAEDSGAERRLWLLLKASVEEKGKIEILYATPAKGLVQNPQTGEILGVFADQLGKPTTIKARRAVILTTGGFENNQEMVRDFLPNMPYCYPKGTPYNTGDGIKMAMAAGADLWHMQNSTGPNYGFKAPEVDYVAGTLLMRGNSYVLVGAAGTRFTDESCSPKHGKVPRYGQWVPAPTPVPLYVVFDEATRMAGPLNNTASGWSSVVKKETWSKDSSAEIAKGWIVKADTIKELAGKIGLNGDVLENTVKTYNGYCAVGKDPEFGRDPKTLKAVGTGPYYAMPLVPCFLNTLGGPKRNAKAQIVRPSGNPIPRLYSAGQLGSLYSFLYQAGGNNECMAFGRVAGRMQLQKPWG